MSVILKTLYVGAVLAVVLVLSSSVSAQELHQDVRESVRAQVVDILEEEYRPIAGTGLDALHQKLVVEILEGDSAGERVEIESDFYELKKGERFFLTRLERIDGSVIYAVGEPDRRPLLLAFFALFVAAVLSFGFWKGVRSVVSLIVSFAIIIFLLLPRLLDGAAPVPTSILFASLILAFAMYITHGFNKVTHAAFLGTVITVVAIGILAYIGVSVGRLSGFASDQAIYLNLQTGGLLDISGLLLAAIIIGVLGILDDISITQSATVRELYRAAPHLTRRDVFSRALLIGKEHVVSLVNTLALAYVGASLPLLLLFSQSEAGFLSIVNMEIFATEIIRTLVGSIGLILAVPVTTVLAAFLLVGARTDTESPGGEAEGPHIHHHHH